jgi:hypothetical protein
LQEEQTLVLTMTTPHISDFNQLFLSDTVPFEESCMIVIDEMCRAPNFKIRQGNERLTEMLFERDAENNVFVVSAMSKWKLFDEKQPNFPTVKSMLETCKPLENFVDEYLYPTLIVYDKEHMLNRIYHLKEERIYIGYSFTYRLHIVTEANICFLKKSVQKALAFIHLT